MNNPRMDDFQLARILLILALLLLGLWVWGDEVAPSTNPVVPLAAAAAGVPTTEVFSAPAAVTDLSIGWPEVAHLSWATGRLEFKSSQPTKAAQEFFDTYLKSLVDNYIRERGCNPPEAPKLLPPAAKPKAKPIKHIFTNN